MMTLSLPTGTVTLHDSAHFLPESRRVLCDYYTLIDSGIGSTIADVDRHFETIAVAMHDEIHLAGLH